MRIDPNYRTTRRLKNIRLLCYVATFLLFFDSNFSLAYDSVDPKLLSYWNIYTTSDDKIILNKNTYPYTLKNPLFSDYAWKWRAFKVPENKKIFANRNGEFEYPEGTLLIKTFYYPKFKDSLELLRLTSQPLEWNYYLDKDLFRPIETRLLQLKGNKWKAYIYIWNREATKAILSPSGSSIPLTASNSGYPASIEFNYQVPSRSQCSECHGGYNEFNQQNPLGPSLDQTNIEVIFNNTKVNQVKSWAEQGLLNLPGNTSRKIVSPAREYLHTNCGHCHNPTGTANSSGLFLHRDETDPWRLGLCKPTVAAGRGSLGLHYNIVPGLPGKSILLQRMRSTAGDIRMPELGRSLLDKSGALLVEDWINSFKVLAVGCYQ